MNENTQIERKATETLTREKIRTPMTLREGRSSTLRTLTAEEIQGVRGGYSGPGTSGGGNHW
jgi:hypothetical protein